MRVFISHSSKDHPASTELATELKNLGHEIWYDNWEIGAGDDFISQINHGLDQCEAGLLVFSSDSDKSKWVNAEVSYLTYARVNEGKLLIPLVLDAGAWVPPLLRPLARLAIQDVQAIDDALRNRRPLAPVKQNPELGKVERVLITLCRTKNGTIEVEVKFNALSFGKASYPRMPWELAHASRAFVEGSRTGIRSPATAERAALETGLKELGDQLRAFCLPEDAAAALQDLVEGCKLGATVEVCFEANAPDLLALPFEALRLRNDLVLALHPVTTVFRRPFGLKPESADPLAGPLKILVAIGAPDEDKTNAPVLNLERETQFILDAVEPANRLEHFQVRFLEVGSPKVIGESFLADAYHILHISCHGSAGNLELEDEDGGPLPTTAAQLLKPLRAIGRPFPLVILNSCHGGVQTGEAASFAEDLLRAGAQSVIAMQTSVTDIYATDLASKFYLNLAEGERLLPSRALAAARKSVEEARLIAVRQNPEAPTSPEYATAALFIASEEHPLANFGGDQKPLKRTPRNTGSGPVPQLRLGDLIGRRKELRTVLKTLRDTGGKCAGVVLTGIGGIGKSTIAGRAIQRMEESGYFTAQHKGRFNLDEIATSLASAFLPSKIPLANELAGLLLRKDLPEQIRLGFVQRALSEVPVVLVLDDFERNLALGGDAFIDENAADYMHELASAARAGRLLITCRYPIPKLDTFLQRVPVGPLSQAETRKLLLRLEGLSGIDPEILRKIGGHPRMLELLQAIGQGYERSFSHVKEKLRELQALRAKDPGAAAQEQKEGFDLVLLLGSRDIFLDELVEMVRSEGLEEFLFQTAVSNLPVSPSGLARMLDENGGDPAAAQHAISRLHDLSLVYLDFEGSASVHRWTAEGLNKTGDEVLWRERANHAGRYREWRAFNESRDLTDIVEAVRNWLVARNFDDATDAAGVFFRSLQGGQQSSVLGIASEILETLPETHGDFAYIAGEEASAQLALGRTERAFDRYRQLLSRYESLSRAEPDRADLQRGLSVSYEKVGDLYRSLGQGDLARDNFLNSLAIRQKLASAEPARADFQRDLFVSYNKIGDLYRDLGQGDLARDNFLNSLAIAQKLANAEPARADFQRHLSVSYERVGDLYRDLGQGDLARDNFLNSLAIRQKLANAEPARADFQRDLSVSLYNLAGVDQDNAGQFLSEAASILHQLKDTGRLNPPDEPILQQLDELLANNS